MVVDGNKTSGDERKKSTTVVITMIICATVVILSVLWMFFAICALDKSNEIVKSLPKDLRTINITANNGR